MIPDDVTIQVLTQSRAHLIEKTFESIRGCKKAIIHLYNSTSVLQRDVVFNMSKQEIIDIAVEGAKLFNEEVKNIQKQNLLLNIHQRVLQEQRWIMHLKYVRQ